MSINILVDICQIPCYVVVVNYRNREILEIYKNLWSYTTTGKLVGLSRQRIHQIVAEYKNTGSKGRKQKYLWFNFTHTTCYLCRKTKVSILHHIDFNNSNDKISNLIPLCKKCHIKVHRRHRNGNGYKPRKGLCVDCNIKFSNKNKHWAKGRCTHCYYKFLWRTNPKRREYARKYYKKNYSA